MVNLLGSYGIIGIIAFICMIWILYDTWAVRKADAPNKIIWTILGIFLSIPAAIVYWILYKR